MGNITLFKKKKPTATELLIYADPSYYKSLAVGYYGHSVYLYKKMIICGSFVIPQQYNAIEFCDSLQAIGKNHIKCEKNYIKCDKNKADRKDFMNYPYNKFMESVPIHITKLVFRDDSAYNDILLMNLPQHIEYLDIELRLYYDKTCPLVDNLPSSLKTLKLIVKSGYNMSIMTIDENPDLEKRQQLLFKPKLQLPFGCQLICYDKYNKKVIYNDIEKIYFKHSYYYD